MATTKRKPVNKRLNGLAQAARHPEECPVSQVLNVIGHRWAVQVLWTLYLVGRPLRFRELQRSLEPITSKELTNRLREQEMMGMVHRQVYAEVPPRVEYRLTDVGEAFLPVLRAIADYAERHGSKWNESGGVRGNSKKKAEKEQA